METNFKNCQTCNLEFVPRNKNGIYCSKKCRVNKGLAKLMEERDKRVDLGLKGIKVEDVLGPKQLERFKKATEKQKTWLLTFIETGSSPLANDAAWPDATIASKHVLGHKMRIFFDVTVQDLFRAKGITEDKISEKIMTLLDAQKITKTYMKGDLQSEEVSEDAFAINAGIQHAVKLLRIDPGQKLLLGEDPDNKFTSLSEALRDIVDNKRVEQRPEEAPSNP